MILSPDGNATLKDLTDKMTETVEHYLHDIVDVVYLNDEFDETELLSEIENVAETLLMYKEEVEQLAATDISPED